MHKRPGPLLLVAALIAVFFISACGAKQPIATGKKPGYLETPGGGTPLFTPLTESGAFVVPPAEVLRLVSRLSPKAQGLSSWKDMRFSLEQSLSVAKAKPADSVAMERRGLRVTWGEIARGLERMIYLLPSLDSNPRLLAEEFRWLRLGPDFGFTGYYEPTLKASRVKTKVYNYPIYRLPPDVKSGKPYHSRNAIDRKAAIAGRNLEIAWVDSEVDAFFLHIQGSGRLLFPDGTVTHVLYAGKNNQSYKALGKIMKDEGLLAEGNVNMQSIRQCLIDNPSRCDELLDKNPSYVFFREAAKGPIGGMGKPLTPKVSLAVDRTVVPYASMLFITLPLPDETGRHSVPYYGLGLPQDTGGAIKGNRIDFFCGPGDWAAHTAGYLDTRGAVYILVPAK